MVSAQADVDAAAAASVTTTTAAIWRSLMAISFGNLRSTLSRFRIVLNWPISRRRCTVS
jgi:hypothetical protein